MRRRSSLFAAVAGPRAKWIVFGVWFVVIVGSCVAGIPEKYTDAQENESTSFLPGDAESTKALTRDRGPAGRRARSRRSSSTAARAG